MKVEFFSTDFNFEEFSNIFCEYPCSGSRVRANRRADGRTDMTKLFAVLRTRLKIYKKMTAMSLGLLRTFAIITSAFTTPCGDNGLQYDFQAMQ